MKPDRSIELEIYLPLPIKYSSFFEKLFVSQVLFYSKITSQTQKEIDFKFKLNQIQPNQKMSNQIKMSGFILDLLWKCLLLTI